MRTNLGSSKPILALLLLAIMFAATDLARAQQTTGDLQCRLVDSLGNAIAGVNVSVTGSQLQGTRGAVSNAQGYVNIFNLGTGKVSVRISHSAYRPLVFENVSIQLGRTTGLGTVILQGRMHELPELVISANRSPIIDPATTHTGATLSSSEVEWLPVDRNYRSTLPLLPQANVSYFGDEVNMGGSTGAENKYFVDGVEVTNSFFGGWGTNLPSNFVNEIEVREGGYEAEFPSALGGVVNMVTPSGGNELHASLSAYYTSNRFTAHRQVGLLDPTQGDFSNYDVGLALTGPLISDQLWYYAAYNPKAEQREVAVPGFGTALDRLLVHSFAGKLTWKASETLQMTLMSTGDPTTWYAVAEGGVPPGGLLNPDPYFGNQQQGGVNFSVRGTYASQGGFLLDASASRSTLKAVWEGATERGRNEVLYIDEVAGTMSGGYGFFVDRFIYSNTFNINAMLPAGSHLLKAGAQYKTGFVDENDGGKRITRVDQTTWIVNQDRALMTVGTRIPSLYVQDSWQISDLFRAHVGLRWDNQLFVASNGAVAQKFTNEFQPRIGLNFLPDETQKIFASFGRYYQELGTVMTEAYTDQSYNYTIRYPHDPRVDPSGGDTTDYNTGLIRPEVDGLTGRCYDEFNLGYERLLGDNLKLGIQGIYRTLREAVDAVRLPDGHWVFGNPGKGALSGFPRAQRDYTALVLSLQGHVGSKMTVLASYVLSRNYGNYPGVFDAYTHSVAVSGNAIFGFNSNPALATGLLPNDRTHVFKCAGSYRLDFGLSIGTSFSWQSGTPLSELAYGFLIQPRGTSGRTPAIWDLNARIAYDLPLGADAHSRLLLDIFHIASRQQPVEIDQQRFLGVDGSGNPYGPNSTYGLAYRYQPAMSVRMGIDLTF